MVLSCNNFRSREQKLDQHIFWKTTTMVRVHLVIYFVLLSLSIAKIFHGFKHYTSYQPGRIGIIVTAPHGGTLDPKFQDNGNIWPLRTNGCENALGECVWRHDCNKASIKCLAKTLVDEFTRKIAGEIADEIELLSGRNIEPKSVLLQIYLFRNKRFFFDKLTDLFFSIVIVRRNYVQNFKTYIPSTSQRQ